MATIKKIIEDFVSIYLYHRWTFLSMILAMTGIVGSIHEETIQDLKEKRNIPKL